MLHPPCILFEWFYDRYLGSWNDPVNLRIFREFHTVILDSIKVEPQPPEGRLPFFVGSERTLHGIQSLIGSAIIG